MIQESGTQKLRPASNVLHPLMVRITHWLNAVAILVMIGSGWRIYNQEPLFGFSISSLDDIGRPTRYLTTLA